MTGRDDTIRRGSPLALLAIVLVLWTGGRAMTWENPFPAILDLPGAELLFAENEAPDRANETGQPWDVAADPFFENMATVERKASPRSSSLALLSSALIAPEHGEDPARAFGHQLLMLSALGAKLSFEDSDVYALKTPESMAGVTPIAPPTNEDGKPGRWSFDAWGFWREGSGSTAISQGRVTIYGASQIGANLQYRIAPSSSHDPRLYARAYRAMVSNGETEIAAGASARPIGSLPVRLAAELRVTERRFGTDVRPAIIATTELPAQTLPAGFKLEAYGGAGYVGGPGATLFADGQAAVTRELADFQGPSDTRARLSLGAGAWGGAQNDARRVDVGPTMRLDLTLGKVPARISVDWRERVGGDASPGSGVAATLSTRF
uniref:hypothetical protein n=1 Tax=uncultured Erythrobacter sp. TaxID=263913 RepID=UPI002624BF5A|nr:hypothetical protein [uncultured Erythrobacter sp.]